MQQANFEAQKRDVFGKGSARALRRAGQIPAILYGRKKETMSLQLDEIVFQRFLRSHGESVFINLDIGDYGVETVMVKEVQRDPVNQKLLHADLLRVSLEESVTSAVPVVLVGSAPGILEGGILEFPHRQVLIRCLPALFPEEFRIDISGLGISDIVFASDLPATEGVEFLDDPHTRIVAVTPPKVVEELEEAEEGIEEEIEATAGEEPEMVSRRRDDEE